jgi:hypothetical protein
MAAITLSNDVLPRSVLRHGAYLCLRPSGDPRVLAQLPVGALGQRLGFQNEFDVIDGHPDKAIAFLRRVDATPAQIPDEGLLRADVVVHVASATADSVRQFGKEACGLFDGSLAVTELRGVVRPTSFTGGAMQNFAYARQVQQGGTPTSCPGTTTPDACCMKATRLRRQRESIACYAAPMSIRANLRLTVNTISSTISSAPTPAFQRFAPCAQRSGISRETRNADSSERGRRGAAVA